MDHQVDTASITWMVLTELLKELEGQAEKDLRNPRKDFDSVQINRGILKCIDRIKALDPAENKPF